MTAPRTYRCFAAPAAWEGEKVTLDAAERRHLVTVLRAEAGHGVVLFDGTGREAHAVIASINEDSVVCTLSGEPIAAGDARAVQVTLLQCIPKAARMDLIVEKATELGCSRIVPIMSERVVSKWTQKQAESKHARWSRIALSAARQCKTRWVPEILPISSLADALGVVHPGEAFLVGSLGDDVRLLRDELRELGTRGVSRVAILIGPEGDLTPAELQAARDAGAVPVTFGELVLRVETAALYALSAIAYELGRDFLQG